MDETEHARAILKRATNDAVAQDVRESAQVSLSVLRNTSVTWQARVKDFFDRTYEELKDDAAVNKKPYAVVISAGNDGSGALMQIERICKGYRFRKVQKPILCKGRVTGEILSQCSELGSTIAEGVNAGIF